MIEELLLECPPKVSIGALSKRLVLSLIEASKIDDSCHKLLARISVEEFVDARIARLARWIDFP